LPSPTPSCEETVGRIEYTAYPGKVLPQDVPLRVYLPPCYDFSDRIYPSLYLLHGKPQDEAHWMTLGVVEQVDAAVGGGIWPAFVMIMARQPEPLFSYTDGGQDSYEAELLGGLVPYIDRTYRTDTRPQARALAGISRGGVWALEVAFRNPGVFDTVAALSPALNVNYARRPYDPFAIVTDGDRLPSRIYLMAGLGDSALEETRRLSRVLSRMGVEHTLTVTSGGHEGGTWKAVLPEVLDFLVADWTTD
jgi:enterochelin esterase-like enzyme